MKAKYSYLQLELIHVTEALKNAVDERSEIQVVHSLNEINRTKARLNSQKYIYAKST